MKPGVLNCGFLFPKYAKTHLRAYAIPKNFSGLHPRDSPLKGEGKEFKREGEMGKKWR
jgi:hypothetical protein